jgi:predicted nuclease of predicted toxin-antitoxin system
MALLLADENFPRPVTLAPRALGHDVVTAQEAGLGGQPDADVLAHATHVGRAVLTLDRDFLRLHAQAGPHTGIVHCTPDPNAAALAGRIDAAVNAAALAAALLRVRRPPTP